MPPARSSGAGRPAYAVPYAFTVRWLNLGWFDSAVAAVGVLIAGVGMYYGLPSVQERRRRRQAVRRTGGTAAAPGPTVGAHGDAGPGSQGAGHDVFVSCAPADAVPAEQLAGLLRSAGLTVFLARVTTPGSVTYLVADRAVDRTANGILLYSRTVIDDPDPQVRDEYAALLQRVHSGGRLFVPALLDDVEPAELPPFARIRGPVDLRRPGTGHHDDQIAALVRALSPPPPSPPPSGPAD